MNHSDFEKNVFSACKKIPNGKVSTYSAICRAVGKPKAFRAVGNALSKSPGMPVVPCHRVIKSGGAVGGFAFGKMKKICLLKKDGIEIKGNRINCLEKYLFKF